MPFIISSASSELQEFRKENHLVLMTDDGLLYKPLPLPQGNQHEACRDTQAMEEKEESYAKQKPHLGD